MFALLATIALVGVEPTLQGHEPYVLTITLPDGLLDIGQSGFEPLTSRLSSVRSTN